MEVVITSLSLCNRISQGLKGTQSDTEGRVSFTLQFEEFALQAKREVGAAAQSQDHLDHFESSEVWLYVTRGPALPLHLLQQTPHSA